MGMGVVYKAEDMTLRRFVALKFLPDDIVLEPVSLLRFHREAQAASALNHPNICTIYEIGEQEGRPFIVMEFLDGMNFDIASPDGRLKLKFFCRLRSKSPTHSTRPTLPAWFTAISSPQTFLSRGEARPRNPDFGLAKMMPTSSTVNDPDGPGMTTLEEDLTSPGTMLGTVAYMSPEQVRGRELDARTDLFSFGSVLYEMATGKAPFRGESSAVTCEAILNRAPIPRSASTPISLWSWNKSFAKPWKKIGACAINTHPICERTCSVSGATAPKAIGKNTLQFRRRKEKMPSRSSRS